MRPDLEGPSVNRRQWLAAVLTVLQEFNATQVELHERLLLMNRPWEEEFVHWAYDGHHWQLHGHLLRPSGGWRRGTTSTGWCPARRRGALRDAAGIGEDE